MTPEDYARLNVLAENILIQVKRIADEMRHPLEKSRYRLEAIDHRLARIEGHLGLGEAPRPANA